MTRKRARKRIVWAGLCILALVLMLGCGWLFRTAILQGAADLWVVSDPLEDADAVAVLGGGVNTRPFAAADLYKAGKVKFVLLASVMPSQIEKYNIVPSHTELNYAVLIDRGVAPEVIIESATT